MVTDLININCSYLTYVLPGSIPYDDIIELSEVVKAQCEKSNKWKVFIDTRRVERRVINDLVQFYHGQGIANILGKKSSLSSL